MNGMSIKTAKIDKIEENEINLLIDCKTTISEEAEFMIETLEMRGMRSEIFKALDMPNIPEPLVNLTLDSLVAIDEQIRIRETITSEKTKRRFV